MKTPLRLTGSLARSTGTVFVLAAAFLVVSGASAEWSCFQGGPSHSGIAPEFSPPLETAWTIDLKEGIYASPVWAEGRAFVATEKGTVCAVLPEGRIAWKTKVDGLVYASTPSVSGGKVYLGVVRNRPKGGALYCLSATDGAILWARTVGGHVFSSPLVAGGRVYFGSDDWNVYALDAGDGREIWRFRTSGEVHDNAAALSGENIVIGSRDRTLYALEASSGSPVWRFRGRKRFNTTPAVDGDEVLVGEEDGTLYALSAPTGGTLWTWRSPEPIVATPAILPDRVIVASTDGSVVSLSRKGARHWRYKVGPHVVAPPVVAGKWIYTAGIDTLGILDQYLYALDIATGEPAWKMKLAGPMFAAPAPGEGILLVAAKKGRLYGLKRKG
jgi:outer membrane protein assembly factor BamB